MEQLELQETIKCTNESLCQYEDRMLCKSGNNMFVYDSSYATVNGSACVMNKNIIVIDGNNDITTTPHMWFEFGTIDIIGCNISTFYYKNLLYVLSQEDHINTNILTIMEVEKCNTCIIDRLCGNCTFVNSNIMTIGAVEQNIIVGNKIYVRDRLDGYFSIDYKESIYNIKSYSNMELESPYFKNSIAFGFSHDNIDYLVFNYLRIPQTYKIKILNTETLEKTDIAVEENLSLKFHYFDDMFYVMFDKGTGKSLFIQLYNCKAPYFLKFEKSIKIPTVCESNDTIISKEQHKKYIFWNKNLYCWEDSYVNVYPLYNQTVKNARFMKKELREKLFSRVCAFWLCVHRLAEHNKIILPPKEIMRQIVLNISL